jgi:hypothetical protein
MGQQSLSLAAQHDTARVMERWEAIYQNLHHDREIFEMLR